MSRPLAYVTSAWSITDYQATRRNAIGYCRLLYEEGYSPICPLLLQDSFIDDYDAKEHKDSMDMAEELLRRSRVVVVCGPYVDDKLRSDIALAKRLGIVTTTLNGILEAGEEVIECD